MRKFLCFSAAALLAALLVTQCKKVPEQLVDAGYMTANVSGAAFNSSSCYESFVLSGTEDHYIKGTGTDGSSFIMIRLRKSKLIVSTDTFDGTQTTHSAWYIKNGATFPAVSGTVTISVDSPGVASTGSFNFTTADGTAVTGGSFRAVFK